MSYRTFKRVLGETNLERKCRWWFGVSLAVLLTLSFTWYGRRTDQIVQRFESRRSSAPSWCAPVGWKSTSRISIRLESNLYRDLVDSSRDMGRKFEWDAILPGRQFRNAARPKNFVPRDAQEQRWLAEWAAPLAPISAKTSSDGDQRTRHQFLSGRDELSRAIHRRSRWPPLLPILSADVRGRHLVRQLPQALGECGAHGRILQAGDLMAMIRVTTDYDPTADEVANNRAYLWVAAIVVGFVSMFSLWAVVRYVIVKPVTHLRDVANAVREGDVEKRAVIRTGDEFEELGAAFNRMLRQLLSQQSELKQSKGELDERLDELAQANMRALRNEPPQERLPGHREPRAAHAAQQHSRLQRRAQRHRTRSTTSSAATSATSSAPAACCSI